MKVLSLFDGMSCGMLALERAWIKVDQYYASEIDKYAIAVSQHNYPDIIQLWDVNNWQERDLWEIDLIIGGSPCQWFSFAGKQLAFDDPRSKLFFTMVDIINHYKPKYFLLENVKMKKEYQQIITDYMWVEPIEINSALVSAQNRRRLYWTNIPWIKQPQDKWILLKDILEDEVDESHYVNAPVIWSKSPRWARLWVIGKWWQGERIYGKAHQSNSIYGVANKSVALSALWWWRWAKTWLYAVEWWRKVRKLTPIECERLQTVPDDYTLAPHPVYQGKMMSNSQRYKMLGNWWTVDVIAHIFKNI